MRLCVHLHIRMYATAHQVGGVVNLFAQELTTTRPVPGDHGSRDLSRDGGCQTRTRPVEVDNEGVAPLSRAIASVSPFVSCSMRIALSMADENCTEEGADTSTES